MNMRGIGQDLTMKKFLLFILLVLILIGGWLYFVKGYMGVRKRHSVPAQLIYKAAIPGMENIRIMIDPLKIKSSDLSKEIYKSGLSKATFHNPEINVLVVSGGGANGAYSAGMLCGWSDAGSRPEFDIVTGVSTGALISPAAFLGSDYDGIIKDIYTNISDADIMKRDLLQFIFEGRPSLMDTQPLRRVLKRTVTMDIMRAVARAHAEGRRLYIATTNLDAKRMVIWDMGAIASADTPEALELFRNVMLASASIPVAFPPVMLTVEAEGALYNEMHVDGSVAIQMFGALLIVGYDEVKSKKTNVYAIRNGKLADVPTEVKFKMWDIAGASFATLMTWQGYGDIYRFASLAKNKEISFYFAAIPYEFDDTHKGVFDLDYMRKLFYRGYKSAISGAPWLEIANLPE